MRPDEPPRRNVRPYDAAHDDHTDAFWGPEHAHRRGGRDGDPSRPVRRHDVPVTAWSHHRADPTKVRAGLFVAGMLLLGPIVISMRPGRATPLVSTPIAVAAPAEGTEVAQLPVTVMVESAPTLIDPSRSVPVDTTSSMSQGAQPAEPSSPGSPSLPVESAGTAAGRRTVSVSDQAAPGSGAETSTTAERIGPECSLTYTAGSGDSWYRIADEAGVPVDDLLDENSATLVTVIHPGDTICLPAGASMPVPPTTSPPTTSPPTTAPPTTHPPTTNPPTTSPPTTNPPQPPSGRLSPAEVQDLIRRTWPADQVDKALAVAWRESNYIATADNGWCCVGVFQIHWTVHRSWLGQFGIHERNDLKDAHKNIAAAHHLWQRQGWGPWGG
ncbi:MAG: LysM peptidoglycan-binding domain-containing protein [Ilumatobacteraceae bacterium]